MTRLPPETLLFTTAVILAGVFVAASVDLPALPLLIALLIGVSLFGLPHGALDPLIAQRAELWTGPLGFIAFNAAYIAIAALTVAIWLLVPAIALAGFLLISAWHFAGDWFDREAVVARLATATSILADTFTAPLLQRSTGLWLGRGPARPCPTAHRSAVWPALRSPSSPGRSNGGRR